MECERLNKYKGEKEMVTVRELNCEEVHYTVGVAQQVLPGYMSFAMNNYITLYHCTCL